MTSRLLSRLNALVLVALTLSGGGGLPLVDALSHAAGLGYAAAPHFETAGGAESHRDFCSLGASLPLSTRLSALHLGIAVGAVSFPDAALHATAPRSADLGLLPQPRAPPSLSA
ncbi:MAG: hypothetical protein ACREOF_17030 [Gemmatimonadales bacterium]